MIAQIIPLIPLLSWFYFRSLFCVTSSIQTLKFNCVSILTAEIIHLKYSDFLFFYEMLIIIIIWHNSSLEIVDIDYLQPGRLRIRDGVAANSVENRHHVARRPQGIFEEANVSQITQIPIFSSDFVVSLLHNITIDIIISMSQGSLKRPILEYL